MKLEIKEPNWWDLIQWYNIETKNVCYDGFITWFKENVTPINKMLAKGTEVFSAGPMAKHGYGAWGDIDSDGCHRKALLINIQPIKKETAEDVLREYLLWHESKGPGMPNLPYDIVARTKAVLEEK